MDACIVILKNNDIFTTKQLGAVRKFGISRAVRYPSALSLGSFKDVKFNDGDGAGKMTVIKAGVDMFQGEKKTTIGEDSGANSSASSTFA